jgi:hypothetical protein
MFVLINKINLMAKNNTDKINNIQEVREQFR